MSQVNILNKILAMIWQFVMLKVKCWLVTFCHDETILCYKTLKQSIYIRKRMLTKTETNKCQTLKFPLRYKI